MIVKNKLQKKQKLKFHKTIKAWLKAENKDKTYLEVYYAIFPYEKVKVKKFNLG